MKAPTAAASDEKKWQAEDDCRTMIAYGEIMADKERHKAAMAMAKKKREALDVVVSGDMSYDDYSKKRKMETKAA